MGQSFEDQTRGEMKEGERDQFGFPAGSQAERDANFSAWAKRNRLRMCDACGWIGREFRNGSRCQECFGLTVHE